MKRKSMSFSEVETALFPIMLVNEQLSPGEGLTSPVRTQYTPTVIETSPQLQNLSITYRKTRNKTRRMGIRIPQYNVLSSVADEAITKEMHDGLGRATTTASSLEAEQGSGNIFKTQTKATPSRPSSRRTSSEGGPWCHVTMGVVLFRLGLKGYLTYPMNHHSEKSGKVTALENELSSTKSVHNKALITLTKRVKKLEKKLKLKRRSAVIDSSHDEEASLHNEDSSKQGRMIEEIDEDENVNLVKSKVVDFSTASPQNDDDDEVTLVETLVNIKISVTKDKGKAIMQESEPPKKLKKKEMIQIGHDEELAQKLHAEELVKDTARQEQESDPAVLRYHKVQNSYEDIRPIFERVWDQNHAFVPKDSKIEKELMKRSGFDLQKEFLKQVEEEMVQQDDIVSGQVMKESSRKAEGRLKSKTLKARKDKDKRQKNQDDPEKLTLMEYVEVISDSEEVISVIPLVVKSSIVSWKSYCKEDVGYYEIHKADRSCKTYIFFSEMLNDFGKKNLLS
ncbi:hypothetical protein Tco_0117609 [Tanacetum coccineum]